MFKFNAITGKFDLVNSNYWASDVVNQFLYPISPSFGIHTNNWDTSDYANVLSGKTITVNPVTDGTVTQVQGGSYMNPIIGYVTALRVYSFKTVGSIRVYSTDYYEMYFTDNGSGVGIYDVLFNWTAGTPLGDYDGFICLFYSDYYGYAWDRYYSITGTTLLISTDDSLPDVPDMHLTSALGQSTHIIGETLHTGGNVYHNYVDNIIRDDFADSVGGRKYSIIEDFTGDNNVMAQMSDFYYGSVKGQNFFNGKLILNQYNSNTDELTNLIYLNRYISNYPEPDTFDNYFAWKITCGSAIYANGTITATGELLGSNFSGSSSGTNTGDQNLSGYVTGSNTGSNAHILSMWTNGNTTKDLMAAGALTFDTGSKMLQNFDTSATGMGFQVQNSTTNTIFGLDGTAGYIGTFSNHDFKIKTNNTTRATILNTGEIGIGIAPASGVSLKLNGWVETYNGFLNNVGGTGIAWGTPNQLDFYANGSIRANFDTSGKFNIFTSTIGSGISTFITATADAIGFVNRLQKARGTIASPTVITTGDDLGSLVFQGYSGAGGYVTGAMIKAFSTGTIATTRVPGYLAFYTATDVAPSVPTERMRLMNAGIGIAGCSNPLAPFHLGNYTVNNSVDCQFLISRAVENTISGNGHAFSDSSAVNRDGGIAYNSYDARINYVGTYNYDHYAGFQAGAYYASSGTMTNMYNFVSIPIVAAGTVTNMYGHKIFETTGAGAITNNYGYYVDELTKGSTLNFAFYAAGATKNYFGGNTGIGVSPLFPLDVLGNIVSRTAGGGLYIYGTNGTTFRAALYDSGTQTQIYGDGNGATAYMTLDGNKIGLYGVTTPTAYLHLPAGSATANTAPAKFTTGALLATPELGTIEYYDDGTNSHFYGTIKIAGVTTRMQII